MSQPRYRRQVRQPERPWWLSRRIGPVPAWTVGLAAVAVAIVIAVAAANSLGDTPGRSIEYAVGDPGVGELAPDFELPSVTGATYQLSAQRGRMVLLYFHEGLMCAPCWQQVTDVQRDLSQFAGLGIDDVVAISVDPLAAQAQHAAQNGVSLPVLADERKEVSARYDALAYGMMGGQMPGHTFILVGREGRILWRADYGGPPNFTMYVPNETLLAELRRVLAG